LRSLSDDGTAFGHVNGFPSVRGNGNALDECRDELEHPESASGRRGDISTGLLLRIPQEAYTPRAQWEKP